MEELPKFPRNTGRLTFATPRFIKYGDQWAAIGPLDSLPFSEIATVERKNGQLVRCLVIEYLADREVHRRPDSYLIGPKRVVYVIARIEILATVDEIEV